MRMGVEKVAFGGVKISQLSAISLQRFVVRFDKPVTNNILATKKIK